MAKLTVVFGILLVLLGVFGFVATGSVHYTALIPCAFGVLLAIFGLLAQTPDASRRKLFMHVAVTIGLRGLSGHGDVAGQLRPVASGQSVPLSRRG